MDDSLLKIINYLFKKNNILSSEDNIDEFFEKGSGFPRLIEIAFNIDEIPGIYSNPTTKSQQKINNDLSFQYLCRNNQYIADSSPSFESTEDKANI